MNNKEQKLTATDVAPQVRQTDVGGSFCVATIVDIESGQWWCKFYGVTFKVLSIRLETVIVKCCQDEGYLPPYNIHELPKKSVKIEFI